MATKIRLQRHGKKRSAFYHIVIADARAKRDGKYIERIGTYNPNTNPATIDLKFERALHWVGTGAQPTDTARALLSYKGVMLKNHLDRGVLKGALTQAQADKKFEAWMKEKDAKISGKSESIEKAQKAAIDKQLAKEKEQNEAKAAAIAAKEAPAVEEAPAEENTEATATETPEAAVEEAPAAEVKEEAAPEATVEEAPTAEVKEEAAPEAKAEEAPAAEVKEEETPEAKAEEAKEGEEEK